MKHALLVAVSSAALSLAGCNSGTDNTDAGAAATATADALGIPTAEAPAADASTGQGFANAAAASDMFEIESSRLAADKAESDKIKRFAEEMIKAHTDSTAKLNAAAAQATPAITPAPQMTPMQQQAIADLTAKSGAEFDRAYAKAQADAHQMTLDMLRNYSANGDVAPLKQFATDLVPIVNGHLEMARGL